MKTLLIVVALVAFAAAARIVREERVYTTAYDNIDVDKILQNSRLLDYHIRCVLDKGPCNKEGKELKSRIPDAIANECEKCSEVQKEKGKKVAQFLMKNRAAEWKEIEEKYKHYHPSGTTPSAADYEKALAS